LIIRSPSTIDSTLEDISITISGDLLSWQYILWKVLINIAMTKQNYHSCGI
jgi:hypothetical protein